MSKFEVGQRVRCFDVNGTDDGEVVKVEPDCITVRHGGHNYSKPGKGLGDQGWHPYQVRRLRKKPSPPAKGERERMLAEGLRVCILWAESVWSRLPTKERYEINFRSLNQARDALKEYEGSAK